MSVLPAEIQGCKSTSRILGHHVRQTMLMEKMGAFFFRVPQFGGFEGTPELLIFHWG